MKGVQISNNKGALLLALPPYMTPEKYGEMVGLTTDCVFGMISRNQIASVKVGRRVLVNVLQEVIDLQKEADLNLDGLVGE
jgi:hypothetical protein